MKFNFYILVLALLIYSFCNTQKLQADKAKDPVTLEPVDLKSVTIKIDGSSTVFPISEALAEEYSNINKVTRIIIGISGTGGGFKKFCNGESDIANASRPIKASEVKACADKSISFIELPVAYDAITVVVNPKNSFANDMQVAELKKLWEPEAQNKIKYWNQIRADWPNQLIKLYGAGTDSGTFDYFTEAVIGQEKASRGDYTSSEDDNVIVQGVSSDSNALGYFGLAYYLENQKKLKAVAIEGISPSPASVNDGSYKPLSRPLFIYVRKDSANRKAVNDFVKFYIENVKTLASEVGYVPLPDTVNVLVNQRFEKRIEGSVFGEHSSQVGMNLESLLK